MHAAPKLNTPEISQAHSNDLVLIGGGSTAATILIRLRDTIKQSPFPVVPFVIHGFDPKGFPNGGIAYGQCSPHHILNSVRTEMSPWRSDAFHEYCVEQGIGGCKNDFNPRSDYAGFLKKEIAQVIRDLESYGITFRQYPHDVRIEGDGVHFNIVDTNYKRPLLAGCEAQQIVIAAGYGPNNNFARINNEGSPHYLSSIYTGDADILKPLHQKSNPHVVFIGSGPALYDFVNDLHGNGLTHARLSVITGKSARVLNVRDVSIEAQEKNITPKKLQAIGNTAEAADLCRAILHDFNTAAASPRRAALDILRHIKTALTQMTAIDASEFQKGNFLGWLKHTATPVPQTSKLRLQALNPQIIPHRVSEEAFTLHRDHISLQLKEHTLEADLVVNGTGHGRHNAPILEQLKIDGLASEDTKLDALKTTESGYRLYRSGIGCIGPATHVGCDGVESFDIYAQDFANIFVSGRLLSASSQGLTSPQP